MTEQHPIITEARRRWMIRYGDMRGWQDYPNWAVREVVEEWWPELRLELLMTLDMLPNWPEDEPVPYLPRFNHPIAVASRDITAGELVIIGLDGKIKPSEPGDLMTSGMISVPISKHTIDWTLDTKGPIDNGEDSFPFYLDRREKQSAILVGLCLLALVVFAIVLAIS